MAINKMINFYLYTRYERFWHWLQVVLILLLLITGFEVHGEYTLIGFETAVIMHNFIGLAWLIAFAFFVFWVFTTGEWKQYVPTSKKMFLVIRYYAYGIFKREPHPVPKSKSAKHNPLQRIVYLLLAVALLPIQMISGLLYWGYNSWDDWGLGWLSLELIVITHMVAAFCILAFLIVHAYMTTTGHQITTHLKTMITGWGEVEEGEIVEAWEKKLRR